MVRGINGCLQESLRNGIYRKNNARVKAALALKRQRARNSPYFLLEGFREIHRALISGYRCLYVFCGESISEKERDFDKELSSLGIEKFYCSKEVLERLSFKEHPDHFIAVFRKKTAVLPRVLRIPAQKSAAILFNR